MRQKANSAYRPTAVKRTLQILEYLAQTGPSTVQQMVRDLGLPRSSLLGLLQVLEDSNYLRRTDSGKYALGFQILFLSQALLEGLDLSREALPFMRLLSEETQETVHLGVLDKGDVVYIQKVESPLSVKMTSRIGARVPCYCTALGKVLLAWLPTSMQEAILCRKTFPPRTPATITSADVLRAELHKVRSLGYAVDNEEHEKDVRCVAAPIRNHEGQVIAALSVSGPASRLSPDRITIVADLVMRAADQISCRMGYRQRGGI